MWRRLCHALSAIRRDRRGVAALEFAVITPFMAALVFTVYDIGNAVQQNSRLEAAVRAGGQYAMSYPTSLSSGSSCSSTSYGSPAAPGTAKCAVVQALPSAWTDVTVTVACGCTGSSFAACTSISNAGCSGPPRYVQVTASRPYATVMPSGTYSLLPITSNTVSYVVRVQ